MRILIDIPEEAYKTIMNTSFVRDVDLTFKQSAKDIEQTNAIFSLIDALDNGTPIPDNATNDVLEQIRAEIKHLLNRPSLTHVIGYDKGFVDGIDKVLQIIDKYKGDKE